VQLYFCDTSALVKRYVNEMGTAWINALFDPTLGHVFYVARITAVELTAALTRRSKGGGLSPADASKALAQFRADFAGRLLVIEITPPLLDHAERLAEKHALRAYDAVQLAALFAMDQHRKHYALPPLTLMCADAELLAAAVAEGFTTDDPNLHP
jgi:predicted nucleic acid-binding protein